MSAVCTIEKLFFLLNVPCLCHFYCRFTEKISVQDFYCGYCCFLFSFCKERFTAECRWKTTIAHHEIRNKNKNHKEAKKSMTTVIREKAPKKENNNNNNNTSSTVFIAYFYRAFSYTHPYSIYNRFYFSRHSFYIRWMFFFVFPCVFEFKFHLGAHFSLKHAFVSLPDIKRFALIALWF